MDIWRKLYAKYYAHNERVGNTKNNAICEHSVEVIQNHLNGGTKCIEFTALCLGALVRRVNYELLASKFR